MKTAKDKLRLDDLRSAASAALAASGIRPEVATTLAGHLLWFDVAGLADSGIATLPHLVDCIRKGEIDPKTEPKIGPEKAALAVLDGRNGPPLLTLSRAANVASEKAREYGSCIVRVTGIGPVASALAAVAEIAIGPMIGAAVGPNGSWSVALPSADGLPLLADRVLGSEATALASFAPWSPLAHVGEWILQAISVPTLESLSGFQQRVAEFSHTEAAGTLTPERWEALRHEAREHGVSISKATRSFLKIGDG